MGRGVEENELRIHTRLGKDTLHFMVPRWTTTIASHPSSEITYNIANLERRSCTLSTKVSHHTTEAFGVRVEPLGVVILSRIVSTPRMIPYDPRMDSAEKGRNRQKC